jgi:hypothetical protein
MRRVFAIRKSPSFCGHVALYTQCVCRIWVLQVFRFLWGMVNLLDMQRPWQAALMAGSKVL